jgi:phosphotransferase system enzyme I (PtsI)
MSRASDVRVKANAVSRGVALGEAVCLFGNRRQFFRSTVSEKQVPKELRRFRAAVRLAIRQLKRMEKDSEPSAGIVEFQRMVLNDPVLLGEIETRISDEKVNAEWAVKSATDNYVASLKSIPDERLRERYHDIEDVTDRLLAALGGGRRRRAKS